MKMINNYSSICTVFSIRLINLHDKYILSIFILIYIFLCYLNYLI